MIKYEKVGGSNTMGENRYNVMAMDDGYGDVKYDSKGTPNLIPSFVTTFKHKPKDNFFSSSRQNLKYVASEVDNQKYVVGDYAMRLDPNISWAGGERKHEDKRFPILFKTTLGLMSRHTTEVIDTLMMNLPIRYDTPERRGALEGIARGTHHVGISEDGINFVQKKIIVASVEIKKQPFGSLCDAILNNNGDIINSDLAKGFNVIVDIGARTLNIMTLEALEEQPELTTQSNDGMYAAYTQIGEYLEQQLGVIIPDGKLPQIIQDREIRNKDITPIIQNVYEHQANTIMTILDKIFISSWGFITSIIFTGGGSEILRPYLEKAFSGVDIIFLGRYSNVRGLRKYGIRQAKRNHKPTSINVRVGHYEYEQ